MTEHSSMEYGSPGQELLGENHLLIMETGGTHAGDSNYTRLMMDASQKTSGVSWPDAYGWVFGWHVHQENATDWKDFIRLG
jgi:hypothetical protein